MSTTFVQQGFEIQRLTADVLAETDDLGAGITRILAGFCKTLSWHAGLAWLPGPPGRLMLVDTWDDGAARELVAASRPLTFGRGEGLVGQVWDRNVSAWVPDVAAEPAYARRDAARASDLRSVLAFPIRGGGEALGVLEFYARASQEPDATLLAVVAAVGGQVGQFIRRVRMLEDLRSSETRLRLALEAGAMGAWEWDIRSGCVTWSQTLEAIHGLAPGTFPGTFEGYQRDIHFEDRDRVRETIRRTVQAREGHELQYRIIRPDGAIRWLEARGRLELDSNGSPARLLGICTDATARLESAENLRREAARREFLAEATRLVAASLDDKETLTTIARLAVPRIADWCSVDVLGPDGRLERLAAGYADAEKAAIVEELDRRYPPGPDDPHGAYAVVRTGRSELGAEVSDELLEQVTHDEEHLRIFRELGALSYIVVPLRSQDEILGTLTFITGVAESGRRYGEADLQLAEGLGHIGGVALANARLYAEARAAVRGREEILSVVSHDLCNLLQSVLLRAGQLDRSSSLGDRDRRDVQAVRRTCVQMKGLVGDLLDLARIEAGKLSVAPEPTPLRPLVEHVIEAHLPLAAERAQRLTLELERDAVLRCDEERVHQLLSNLLGNALKFTPEHGGITLRVAVGTNDVRFSVVDTGPGIAPELQSRLFERYVQAEGERQGLGLGLFISRAIVDAHGGRMGVESRPGAGSTFWFTLPA